MDALVICNDGDDDSALDASVGNDDSAEPIFPSSLLVRRQVFVL